MDTISTRLAAFQHALSFDELPAAVVEKARLLLLDTIGVCIGSRRLDFADAVIGLVRGWGGPPQATAVGVAERMPAHHAALVNGVLAHGQDFDDTHTRSLVHPSGVLVPAVLAAAQRFGSSGAQALVALAGATEAGIRLVLPARHGFSHRGIQTTMVAGTFGSALAAARLAGFDAARTAQAFGICGSFTSGLMECVPAGASTKQLHPGWAAMSGLMAADFAAAGFTGPATVVEGKLGLYSAFLRGASADLEKIFDGIGTRWELLEIRPKLYPCGHPLNTFIDCAAALRRDGCAPEKIASIVCHAAQGAVSMVIEPWQRKLDPASGYDGRFSLPYVVAAMLVHGAAGAAQFEDASVQDPAVRALMRKISYRIEPAFDHADMPARVVITLVDGSVHSCELAQGRGGSAAPVAGEELLAKFHANAQHLPRERVQRIAEMVLGFERLGSVSELADLLA